MQLGELSVTYTCNQPPSIYITEVARVLLLDKLEEVHKI